MTREGAKARGGGGGGGHSQNAITGICAWCARPRPRTISLYVDFLGLFLFARFLCCGGLLLALARSLVGGLGPVIFRPRNGGTRCTHTIANPENAAISLRPPLFCNHELFISLLFARLYRLYIFWMELCDATRKLLTRGPIAKQKNCSSREGSQKGRRNYLRLGRARTMKYLSSSGTRLKYINSFFS